MSPRSALFIACAFLITPALAQNQPFAIDRPRVMIPVRSYLPPVIPPVRLTNSNRLASLIRAGKLYLSVQDALALAIENNLNLEIDRYGPLLAQSALERAKAGGPIRGVPSASAQVSSVNAGIGVNGSTAAAGLGGGGGGGGLGGGANNTIEQIGVAAPNYDPILQSASTFSHLTPLYSNTLVSGSPSLTQAVRSYSTVLNQGLALGGQVRFVDYQNYLKESALSDALNPAVGPHMDLYLRQPLLQGFGVALNMRGIRIAEINTAASRETFRSQLFNLVVSVLNLYWSYVSASEQLSVRQRAYEITQKFRDDTQYEISIGALAGVELPRAEAELASRRQDIVIAQATVRQQGTLLKEALSHTEDPVLEAADIVPLNHIEVAESEDPPSLRQLFATAMAKRPDVAIEKFKDQTDALNLAGTTNPLLPNLSVTLQTYNRGVAGTPQATGGKVNPFFVGGYGTALGQIFRRNFPSYIEQLNLSAPIGNRSAQADYGIDQLQYRQGQLKSQKDENQILVDIASQVAALKQARARYNTARDTRILQEQLLEAERKKSYGTATFNYIMVDQRALIAAQLSEMNAAAAYSRARIGLDQVLGLTLENNNISLEEGLNGRVERESRPPEIAQTPAK